MPVTKILGLLCFLQQGKHNPEELWEIINYRNLGKAA